MNFGITSAFEYIDLAEQCFWPAMTILALMAGYIMGGCAQRG